MTIRGKTTLIFAAALAAVMLVLIAAVSAARSSAVYDDQADIALEHAKLAEAVLETYRPPDGAMITLDSVGRPILPISVRRALRVVPEYLVVVDRHANVQYTSDAVNSLNDRDWRTMQRGMAEIADGGTAVVLSIANDRIMMMVLPLDNPRLGLRYVAAGISVSDATPWPAALMTTVLVVVPLFIGLATWGVWLVLGGTLARLGRIRREVADITDGRSLHRRLSTDDAEPELVALIATINAMITRLESSFMALRRFTADASHELKTPLAVMRADVERATHEATRKTDRMIALEEALHEITRMTDLVESLLTLARADEGRFDLHREPVDLRALVQEVYETAQMLGEAADVTVSLAFTADVTIPADRARLRQLFLNLVTNAIKYTSAGGRVDLGLGLHPDTVTFAVRDTGIGIAAADLPHVFERFWRADRARSRGAERGGFGLGLAISQWIAHAHGGTLTVSSRLGKGSLFTVTLPLARPELSPPSGTANAIPSMAAGNS